MFKNREILYTKHQDFWQRQSPVLFSIVGALKNGEYRYNGKKYHLSQHGFARDMQFECIFQNASEVHFSLKSDEKTLEKYQFDFELIIKYILEEKSIRVEYGVKNTGNNILYYSIGGHPAFQIRTDIDRYSLVFEKNMENQRVDRIHPVLHLLDDNYSEQFPGEKNILPLSEKYFEIDAMICRDIGSKKVDFCENGEKIFTFSYENFPHLGVWKQLNSLFICLEPWDGYVDAVDVSGNIEEKPGIQSLEVGKIKKYAWSVVF